MTKLSFINTKTAKKFYKIDSSILEVLVKFTEDNTSTIKGNSHGSRVIAVIVSSHYSVVFVLLETCANPSLSLRTELDTTNF